MFFMHYFSKVQLLYLLYIWNQVGKDKMNEDKSRWSVTFRDLVMCPLLSALTQGAQERRMVL